MKKKLFLMALVFLFSLLVRFFQYDQIPGEWYGDISNVHEYTQQILTGFWPFYFFQSPGPLYHYLIAPIAILYHNHGYETYKLASILVSLAGLIATFLFVKEISSFIIAITTIFFMSYSLWFLIWSRLGNSQIVIPALSSLLGLFLVRLIKRPNLYNFILASLTASLGWYTYPQTFLFPFVLVLYISIFIFFSMENRAKLIRNLIITLIVLGICVVPFISIVRKQPDNFGKGYVGEKILPVVGMRIEVVLGKFLINFQKTMLMYHVRGDEIFRMNVSGHPQVDAVSGVLLLLGLLYFLQQREKKWFLFIVGMLVLLPLPSMSPAIPDGEIPNSARTIAVIPYIYLLISAGLIFIYKRLYQLKTDGKIISIFIVLLLTGATVYLNLVLYFYYYNYGLPDRNFAPARKIASYLDEKISSRTAVYFSSCCWGEWGEPEPKAVAYVIRKKRFILYERLIDNCEDITLKPALIITRPGETESLKKFANCAQEANFFQIVTDEGTKIADSLELR